MSAANRDRIACGTLVLRDRRVVFASVGALVLTARSGRDLLGLPLAELVAPEDRERVLDRHERRLRGEPVPTEYEFSLLLPDGGRRACEARVSLEGEEVVLQLEDLSGQAERRPRLDGLAALGLAIQRERTEEQIYRRVRTGLKALDLVPFLLQPVADGVRLAWADLPEPIARAVAAMGRPLEGRVGPWSAFSEAIWTDGAAYSDDWVAHAAIFSGYGPVEQAAAARFGLVRGLGVRLDERAGARAYLVAAGAWIRGGDLPAFRLFGAQVAAALDSARDMADLSARNVELAAMAELGVLAGGALSLDQFLVQASEVIRFTAGCQAIGIYAAAAGEEALRLIYTAGLESPPPQEAHATTFASALGQVVTSRRLVTTTVDQLDERQRAWLEEAGLATFVFVPLVARSVAVGVVVVAWKERLTAEQVRPDVLLTLGAHLASAMETHGLLGDLRRRVGELTLLNDLAMATASLDPVLLLENALRRVRDTLEADVAMAYLSTDGGLEQQATIGLGPASAALVKRLELQEGPAGQALTRRRPVLELTEEEAGPRCSAVKRAEGITALVAVPLLAKDHALGALCLGRRAARPFAGGDVALLSAIGVQLGVAVDAARQHADVRRRARDLEAIHGLALRVMGAPPGEPRETLLDGCIEVAHALSARHAAVMLLDPSGETLEIAASHGFAVPDEVRRLPLGRSPLAAEALARGAPTWTENTAADPRSAMFGRSTAPAMAMLVVPLAAHGRRRGVLLVGDAAGRRFGEAELGLAMALCGELALALANVELFAEARRRAEELAGEREKNIRKSRLEALGEFSAVIAHEVRNPLGVIFNSLGSLRRLIGQGGDARMLLDIVGEEADRLNRIVGDLLDFARHSPPLLQPERLEQVVDDAVSVALAQPQAGLEVRREHQPGLPEIPLDQGQVRQAVINLVVNAAQAMPGGGRLTVRTLLEDAALVVEVEDGGAGVPEEVRSRIFEPFFTTKATGTGLGLPVVKRIVEGHGGELRFRSSPGQTVFSLRFPRAADPSPARRTDRPPP